MVYEEKIISKWCHWVGDPSIFTKTVTSSFKPVWFKDSIALQSIVKLWYCEPGNGFVTNLTSL